MRPEPVLEEQLRRKPTVLVVDDEAPNLETLRRVLRADYQVLCARTGTEALGLLGRNDVAVIIADQRMPGMTGAEFLALASGNAPDAKRILLTAYADLEAIIAAINAGKIHHFARKPWDNEELKAAVDRLVHRAQPDAELRGFRDSVTGLYTHRVFQERLREEVARASRSRKSLTLLLADIDHFKEWNERFGHPRGDQVLREVADLMRGQARGGDVCARFGGEEFALLLPDTSKEGGRTKAERLRDALRELPSGAEEPITLSFGVAEFPSDATTADELLSCADHALYVAKRRGRDQVQLYGEDPNTGERWELMPDSDVLGLPAGSIEAPDRGIPSFRDRVHQLAARFEAEGALGCLYVDLSRLRRIEQEYGSITYSNVLSRAGESLRDGEGVRIRERDLVCRLDDDDDAFLIFLAAPRASAGPRGGRKGRPDGAADDLATAADRLAQWVDLSLRGAVLDLLHHVPRTSVGFARSIRHPMIKSERQLSMLIEEAHESARIQGRLRRQRDKDLLQEIILGDTLSTHYQPIVDFESGQIFGFEALSRGPRRTPLERPIGLFATAEEVDLLFELDRACFRGAIRRAAALEPIHRLFVNVLPPSFYDHKFIGAEIELLLSETQLSPANLVFEITERLAIENLQTFHRALSQYSHLGFGVAIDDVGSKHANLEAVIALRPNFLKLSDIMTRGIARSAIKRELVRSLAKLASTIDAVVVAEGIETAADLRCIRDLGVRYGQGYFLARPAPPFPDLRTAAKRRLACGGRLSRRPKD